MVCEEIVPAWGGHDEELGRVSDIGEHANDLARLIEKLELDCPAVLGVSFGGAIVLEFAAEHPQHLGALIVHGAEARFRTTLGSTIARPGARAIPVAERQSLRQPVF